MANSFVSRVIFLWSVGVSALLYVHKVEAAVQMSVQSSLHRGESPFDPNDVASVGDLSFELFGDPLKPAVTLIHGLGGDKRTWTRVAHDLARDHFVITYDQRGHGQSRKEGENFSSKTMAYDLRALLEQLRIDKTHLVGHSMGARTAARFAAEFPDLTLSVTFEDMHMKGRSRELPDHLEASRTLRSLNSRSFASFRELTDAYSPFQKVLPSRWWEKVKNDDQGQYLFPSRLHNHMLYETQALQEDLTEALRQIRAPVMFLAADLFPVLFEIGIDHARATKPDAKIIVVEGSTHGIHVSQQQLFLTHVREFLDSASAATAGECGRYFGLK